MRMTVFVITRRRFELFRRCCESVLNQLPEGVELRVIVNGGDPETEAWLASLSHPALHWRVIEEEHRTVCRNRAFAEARGEILYFLDDDVVVPPGVIRAVLDRFAGDETLAVLGGPNLTPPDSPWKEKLFGAIMCNGFTAPMVRSRYLPLENPIGAATERNLILCNLALRRALLPRELRFPVHFRSNEENLFLYHCRSRGLNLQYRGELGVYHRRRSTTSGFLSQLFSYGVGRGEQTWASPLSLHPAFLVPSAVCLLTPLLAALPAGRPALTGLSAIYGVLAVAFALASRECRTLGGRGVLAAAGFAPLVHAAFGLGFLKGWGNRACRWAISQSVQPPEVKPSHGVHVS